MRILGLMSGSSLDGCDIGIIDIVESDGVFQWKLKRAKTYSYSQAWALRLKDLPIASARELARIDYDYAHLIAQFVDDFLDADTIDTIAFHGHTAIHEPSLGFTWQVGNGGALSALTGHQVICDFRSTDIAMGGQGTPLAPIADQYLFPGHVAYLNMGGICNITVRDAETTLAWDVCPCNQILNFLSGGLGMSFDKNGEEAAKGKMNDDFYEILSSNAYYTQDLPKSLDNFYIQKNIISRIAKHHSPVQDQLHTACHFIADQLHLALEEGISKLPVKPNSESVLITGGSARNTFLTKVIQEKIHPYRLLIPDEDTIDYKEIVLMAICAYLRLEKRANVLHQVTGSKRDSIAGAIYDAN